MYWFFLYLDLSRKILVHIFSSKCCVLNVVHLCLPPQQCKKTFLPRNMVQSIYTFKSLNRSGVWCKAVNCLHSTQVLYGTRKSNPFHGFLNGLTQCVYTGFHAINILPRKNSTAFQLNDLNFYLLLRKRWNLPLKMPYLRPLCPYFNSPLWSPLHEDLPPQDISSW